MSTRNLRSRKRKDSPVSSDESVEDIPHRPSRTPRVRIPSRLQPLPETALRTNTRQTEPEFPSSKKRKRGRPKGQESTGALLNPSFFAALNDRLGVGDNSRGEFDSSLQERPEEAASRVVAKDTDYSREGPPPLVQGIRSEPPAQTGAIESEAVEGPLRSQQDDELQRAAAAEELLQNSIAENSTNHRRDAYEVPEDAPEQGVLAIRRPTVRVIQSTPQSSPAKPRKKAKPTSGESGHRRSRAASLELGTEPRQSRGKPPTQRHSPASRQQHAPNTTQEIQRDEELPVEPDGEASPALEVSAEDWAAACIEPSETPTVSLNHKAMERMMNDMGSSSWTGKGRSWERSFVASEGESIRDWLKAAQRRVELAPAKALFEHLDSLRRLCRDMPNAPHLDDQAAYFREHHDILGRLMLKIRASVDQVASTVQEPGSAKRVEAVRERIIPLLVIVLKEVSFLGGTNTTDGGKPVLPFKGQFTSSTLQLLLRVASWTERLRRATEPESKRRQTTEDTAEREDAATQAVVATEAEYDEPAPRKHTRHFANNLNNFENILSQAVNDLEYRIQEPARRTQAIERDRLVKLARARQEKERQAESQRKMRLYKQSMGQLVPQDTQVDDYAATHQGWAYREDERVLEVIRKVARPDVVVLAGTLPGRTAGEVMTRMAELRRRMWDGYSKAGMAPPAWCYDRSRM